jgi:hypothetical protein
MLLKDKIVYALPPLMNRPIPLSADISGGRSKKRPKNTESTFFKLPMIVVVSAEFTVVHQNIEKFNIDPSSRLKNKHT